MWGCPIKYLYFYHPHFTLNGLFHFDLRALRAAFVPNGITQQSESPSETASRH